MNIDYIGDAFSLIQSKKDYELYLEADRIALSLAIPFTFAQKLRYYLVEDVLKFQRLLRKTEFYTNCDNSRFGVAYSAFLKYRLYKTGLRLGFEIKRNCFGPGLSIAHPGTIVVHGDARIGANCRIHPCVVIGTEAGYSNRVPTIGDNCFIGPGAMIFGKITLANDVAIGANAVVNKSFLESNITIAGNPARKVSNKGSKGLLIDALEVIGKKKLNKN
jgi:serine O-acetyltransferase